MFDIGWQELFIIAVAAIIVVGPKDLPRALKTITGLIRKLRGMAREFQSGVDDMVREAELDDLKQEMSAATGGDLRKSIEDAIDPTGEIKDIKKDLNMKDVEADLDKAARDSAAPDAPDAPAGITAPPPPEIEPETEQAPEPAPEASVKTEKAG